MAKNAISIIASENTYENLSTFKTIEELNETVRAHKEAGANVLNKTQVAVLELLHRYSAKYKGVSFLAKNKIAELIGKSRRTVIRACQALEEAGIIRQYEMKRKSDMQQTSNAIVIMPVEISEETAVEQAPVTQDEQIMSHQEEKTFLKQIQNNNHLNMPTESHRKAYVKMVPKRLQQYQAFFGKQIKDLYGRVWLAAKKLDVAVEKDIMQDIAHTAFNTLVKYIKEGRNLDNEQMNKITYTISYNKLTERSEIKDQMAISKALDRLKNTTRPQNSFIILDDFLN